MELKIGNVSLPITVNQQELANFLLSNLFCAPDTNLILTFDSQNRPWLAGKPLEPAEILYWKEQIETFSKSPVWHLLSHSSVELSRRHMFEQSKTNEDMVFGKAMLYIVDYQKRLLGLIAGLPIPQVDITKKTTKKI